MMVMTTSSGRFVAATPYWLIKKRFLEVSGQKFVREFLISATSSHSFGWQVGGGIGRRFPFENFMIVPVSQRAALSLDFGIDDLSYQSPSTKSAGDRKLRFRGFWIAGLLEAVKDIYGFAARQTCFGVKLWAY
jgi:hypothetical protein